MKLYVSGSEYAPGKRKIIQGHYERDDFSTSLSINIPYSVLMADEVDPENKEVCRDLVDTIGRTDDEGESKYFVDSLGNLCENEGWMPREEI